MLRSREERAQRQRELLSRFERPLVCLNMNIPGPVKYDSLIKLAFEEGVSRILGRIMPLYSQTLFLPTGPEGYFVADMTARELKNIAIEVEESDALGRLMDIDVLDVSGRKLERECQRSCIVCGAEGAACARSRVHGLETVCGKIKLILCDHAASFYGALAHRALICEALTTPKPGLVDARNNGAHRDMCLSTLLKSADSLRPFFIRAFRLGLDAEKTDEKTVTLLKREGSSAEADMLRVTGGVNAHKGSIYAFGLLLFAQGFCLVNGGEALETAADIVRRDIEARFSQAEALPQSHGEHAYAMWGARGARGEAAEGFPHAVKATEILRGKTALGKNEAALIALCGLMSELSDTNLLHRGGAEGLNFVRMRAREIFDMSDDEHVAALIELDDEMIRKNLSPGGAADMLALALYMDAARENLNFSEDLKK